jgi:hypothetical protein
VSRDKCPDSDASPGNVKDIHSVLLAIPSVFERLVYIASLADRNDMGEEAGARSRRVLRTEHSAVFDEWLCLSMEQKVEDVKTYAGGQRRPSHELMRLWLQPHCYEILIPPGSLSPARELFREDLEILLQILDRG